MPFKKIWGRTFRPRGKNLDQLRKYLLLDTDQLPTDVKALPKDALVIIEILKDMGIEHDQKVITHLLEFLYR